jgi:hypothetical protein
MMFLQPDLRIKETGKKKKTQLNHYLKRNFRVGKMAEVTVLLQILNFSEANGGLGTHMLLQRSSLSQQLFGTVVLERALLKMEMAQILKTAYQ